MSASASSTTPTGPISTIPSSSFPSQSDAPPLPVPSSSPALPLSSNLVTTSAPAVVSKVVSAPTLSSTNPSAPLSKYPLKPATPTLVASALSSKISNTPPVSTTGPRPTPSSALAVSPSSAFKSSPNRLPVPTSSSKSTSVLDIASKAKSVIEPTSLTTANPPSISTGQPLVMTAHARDTTTTTSHPTPSHVISTPVPGTKSMSVPSITPISARSTKPTPVLNTKPTSVSNTKSASVPNTKSASVPSSKPASVANTMPTSMPSTKLMNMPSTKPTNMPSTKPTSTPNTKPTSMHNTKPSSTPSSKSMIAPSTKSTPVLVPNRSTFTTPASASAFTVSSTIPTPNKSIPAPSVLAPTTSTSIAHPSAPLTPAANIRRLTAARASASTRSSASSTSNQAPPSLLESTPAPPTHAYPSSGLRESHSPQTLPTSKSVKGRAAVGKSDSEDSTIKRTTPGLEAVCAPIDKHLDATSNSTLKPTAELNTQLLSIAAAAVGTPVKDATGNSSSTQTVSQSPEENDQTGKPSNTARKTVSQLKGAKTATSRDESTSSDSPDLEVVAMHVDGSNTTPSPGSTNRKTTTVRSPPQPHFTVPVDEDPIRRYIESRSKDGTETVVKSSQLSEWCEMAWHRIPLNVQQAFDTFEMVRLPRADITSCLFALNLKSHTILRVDVQRKILAIKLVQRQVSLLAVVECKNNVDRNTPSLATEQHWLIRSLPATSVWRSPSFRRDSLYNDIPWTSGDVPEFDEEGNVIPGKPVLLLPEELQVREERTPRSKIRPRSGRSQFPQKRKESLSGYESTPNGSTPLRGPTSASIKPSANPAPAVNASAGKYRVDAKPRREGVNQTTKQVQAEQVTGKNSALKTTGLSTESFDDSEYCRLLHVLCDDRMNRALQAISRPVEGFDPWEEDITPLFNNRQFTPAPIRRYSGGVRASDITGLTPQYVRRLRSSAMLAAKFFEFREMYVSAVRNYLRCEKDRVSFADFSLGRPFVTYAFCLLEVYQDLEPLILRTNTNTREEGPPAKKRRTSEETAPGESVGVRRTSRSTELLRKKSLDENGASVEIAPTNACDRRICTLHSTITENDRLKFETEEARVRMVTAILVAIREARAFAAEAKTPEDRTMCDTVLQQLHAQLSQQVKTQPKQ